MKPFLGCSLLPGSCLDTHEHSKSFRADLFIYAASIRAHSGRMQTKRISIVLASDVAQCPPAAILEWIAQGCLDTLWIKGLIAGQPIPYVYLREVLMLARMHGYLQREPPDEELGTPRETCHGGRPRRTPSRKADR